MNLPEPSFSKNDKLANILIWTVSAVVFAVVVLLHELKFDVDLGFYVHIFAQLKIYTPLAWRPLSPSAVFLLVCFQAAH